MLDTGGWKHDPSEKGNLKVNGGCGVDTRNAAAEKMEDFIGESKTFEQAIQLITRKKSLLSGNEGGTYRLGDILDYYTSLNPFFEIIKKYKSFQLGKIYISVK